MVKGGAIVCRMGARIRRGEELAITRTLARIGIPILSTISGTGVMEGGRLVEYGPAAILLTAPEHPRTRELLAASLALGDGVIPA